MENDGLKKRKAQLELEEQIAQAIKNSTASLNDFAEAQKKISENYKLIKKINQEIAILNEEKNGKTEEEVKKIQEAVDALEQERALLIGINKELSKKKNFAKAIRNEFVEWGKSLKNQFIPSLGEAFTTFLRLNDLAIQTSVNIGLSGKAMGVMVNNIESSQQAWGDLGYDLESSAKIQQSLANETGRQVILSEEAQKQAAMTARALNMQSEEMGVLIGQMDQFGLGSQLAMSSIIDMRIEAEKMGVNSGKVIKKFEQNLELMNKLNFKSGIKGLQKMAALSEKYKIEMSSIASAADKAFRLEGAIEMAAQLRVLGGSIAGLGDPFQLMYKARNNPEKFMEDITQAAKASATWDPKTKEFKISAYEMDRLRVAAEATNMSMEDLVKTARQGAKIDMFERMLSGRNMSPEDKAMLTGLMEMSEQGATINGKLVSEMSDKDLAELLERSNDLKKLQEDAMSAQTELEAIKNSFMLGFVELFKGVDFKSLFAGIKEIVKGLVGFVKTVKEYLGPTGTLITALALYFGTKATFWYTRGLLLGKGFNDATSSGSGGKGFFGRMGDKVKGLFGKKTPAMPEQTASTPQRPTIQQQSPGGITKSMNMKEMIKGAAAILILSAALFVFAKSLQEFDKLQNGWETLGIAAVGLLTLSGALFLISKIPTDGVLKGALAIAALGVAMIPFSFAMGLLGNVDAAQMLGVVVAIGALAGVAALLGSIAMTPVFWVGLAAIASASIVLAGAIWLLGEAMGAAAPGMGLFVTNLMDLGNIINPLLLLGPALIGVSLGVFALAASLVALGAAYLLGGFLGLIALEEVATDIQTAFKGVDAAGVSTAVNAINSIDIDKLNALKELSLWMSLLGTTTTIKFDESLHIDGSIELSGEGGGKSNTDWIKDPIFVSKLQQLIQTQMEKDKNGGKGR